MKNLFVFALLVLCISCVKEPQEGPAKGGDDKAGFDWTTVTTKSVTVASESDIINERGEVVAANLLPGTYAIPTGVNTKLTVRDAIGSKAVPVRFISFPSETKYATMMAEDVFPFKGDYDMNDMVADFRVNYIFDEVYNLISRIRIIVVPRAAGSAYDNIGLAASLTRAPYDIRSTIKSIVRDDNNDNGKLGELFTVDGKMIETGSGNDAVIPLTGDFRSHFEKREPGMLNTYSHLSNNPGIFFSVEIVFDKGFDVNSFELFGNDPDKMNLDLFAVFGDRAKEVHLKGQQPTAKFDKAKYFSSLSDFVTPDNYVWMMMVDETIAYPVESVSIEQAYPDFTKWVESNGNLSYNWYASKNADKVYPIYE